MNQRKIKKKKLKRWLKYKQVLKGSVKLNKINQPVNKFLVIYEIIQKVIVNLSLLKKGYNIINNKSSYTIKE